MGKSSYETTKKWREELKTNEEKMKKYRKKEAERQRAYRKKMADAAKKDEKLLQEKRTKDRIRQQRRREEIKKSEFGKKSKKKKFCQEDNLIKLAVEKLAGSNSQTKESDYLAKSWGTQYEEMDKSQKVIARKIISDVLFHGCLKKLHLNHTVQIHNVFNEGNTAEYYNSLDCSTEVFTSEVPTTISNGASTSRNKIVNPKSEKQKVLYYIENEPGETAMNDSFIVPDGSSTNCYEETSVKNYCSNSEEENE